MCRSSFLRSLLISIILVFVVSLVWSIYAIDLSPANSATGVMLHGVQKNAQSMMSGEILSAQLKNTGQASSLNDSVQSELYQLITGLRPGPGPAIPAAKSVRELPVSDVSFYNQRGNLLSGWLAIRAAGAPTIILAHGTPGNRVDMLQRAAFLFKHGYNVLLFDFQSYGHSQGIMSTLGMVESEDILAAISFLHVIPFTATSKIGVLGLSMGATAAVLAAARTRDIKALVAESCPLDATRVLGDVPNDRARAADRQVVEETYKVDITRARPIDVVHKLAGRTAIFFINGDKDKETPLAGMASLYMKAGAPRLVWVVPGAGHAQSCAFDTHDYILHVDTFFDTYL
jgi:dipeptidyl aminopeptidase/acylaminoacyl peptidase